MGFQIQGTFFDADPCIIKGLLDPKPHGEMRIRIQEVKNAEIQEEQKNMNTF